jgi:hypothetical protein
MTAVTAPKVGEVIERDNGRFVKGVSGNPNGRPKGSRNKITLMKLMAEEAVRENNAEKMLDVCKRVIEQAIDGDKDSQKLVWAAVMSKSSLDTEKAMGDKVQITIGRVESAPKVEKTKATKEVENDESISEAGD